MTFSYELTWWNEIEGEYGKSEKIKGFIAAKNYLDATKKLIHCYGEKETTYLSLEPFSPDDFIEFRENKAELANYVKEQIKEDVMW